MCQLGVVVYSRMVAQQIHSKALQVLGLPWDNFAGHSFRIGAATAAAKAGIEDSVIQSLGRWSSAAFLTYIRILREWNLSLKSIHR